MQRDTAALAVHWAAAGLLSAWSLWLWFGPSASPDSMGSEGLQLLYTGGCIGCHDQLGAGGTVGPDLAGLADRADERVPGMSAADYVRQSIIDPGAYIAPGYETAMPPVRLDGAQVEALVRYLLATG